MRLKSDSSRHIVSLKSNEFVLLQVLPPKFELDLQGEPLETRLARILSCWKLRELERSRRLAVSDMTTIFIAQSRGGLWIANEES